MLGIQDYNYQKFTFSKKQKNTLNKKDITVKYYDKLDDNLILIFPEIYKNILDIKIIMKR